jgi:hypothetical protein
MAEVMPIDAPPLMTEQPVDIGGGEEEEDEEEDADADHALPVITMADVFSEFFIPLDPATDARCSFFFPERHCVLVFFPERHCGTCFFPRTACT